MSPQPWTPWGGGSQSEQSHLPHQTLQTLFSAPRLGEPGARLPLFTPETDKLRLDSPFPFLGSGKGPGGTEVPGGGMLPVFDGRGWAKTEIGCRKEAWGKAAPVYLKARGFKGGGSEEGNWKRGQAGRKAFRGTKGIGRVGEVRVGDTFRG